MTLCRLGAVTGDFPGRMMLFAPSQLRHPWLAAWPLYAGAIVYCVVVYAALLGFGWVAAHSGSFDWSFVPVTG